MKNSRSIFTKMAKPFFTIFCYTFLSVQSVYGDDTEIFFAPIQDVEDVTPNVLFIIDTSGSMTNNVSGTNRSRIDVVKEVMDEVLTDINDVNVGLMRFNRGDTEGPNSSEGGPIVFPITFIDSPAEPVVNAVISDGANDAEQIDAAGTVVIDAEMINLGDGVDSYSALRFVSLLIPQGATITEAAIVYTAHGDSSGTGSLEVGAELVDDSAEFTTVNNSISDRYAFITSNQVSWVPESWENGNSYASPDLSGVIQEVVDQNGWCGGNAMTFFITGSTLRSAYTNEGRIADSDEDNFYSAPKLRVKFDSTLPAAANGCTAIEINRQITDSDHDWERGANDNDISSWYYNWFYYGAQAKGIGLSFENINIPKNATIVDAYVTMTSYLNNGNNGQVEIKGVNLGDPDLTDYSDLIDNATLGPITWNLTSWTHRNEYQSPNLASLVQDIVDRGDWDLGNGMSFYFEGVSGFHQVYDARASTTLSPKISIFYEGTYESGVITKREEMKATIADFPADAWTPISDTMAEAGRYFRGDKVYYGIDRDNVSSNVTSHIDSFDNTGTLDTPVGCTENNYFASVCAAEAITGNPNYVSPITKSCQTSHIVFLTDGYPTSHHTATQDIYNEWSGKTCSSNNYGSECAVEIARVLNTPGQFLSDDQGVKTHTIGFDIDFQLLEDMAAAGGGGYHTADTKDELIEVINNIVSDIASVSTSFVSSGVSVNQYNRLTHNDEMYFSLFSPAEGTVWPGNIKRYRFNGTQIVDVNDVDAVGSNGEFIETSQSWWSDLIDGNAVGDGGAASKRGTLRPVYSDLVGSDLTSTANSVEDGNDLITISMLAASDATDRTNILNWAQGIDINQLPSIEAHNIIGDPLHSQPTLVIYDRSSSESPSYETKVYVGTNHGFLHSFDSETGVDEWSFIPQELFPILSDIQKDNDAAHAYGLDGSISIYMEDGNRNGVVDTRLNEKAYLYVGMRRGGSSYYAIDISDPDSPQLMFSINNLNTSGFSKLGQTWSTPLIKRMSIADPITGSVSERLVLLFGGGYDKLQDQAGTSSVEDQIGNRVYIADAKTGEYLWDSRNNSTIQANSPAGSLEDMNSVPSNISALDLNGDGLIDTFYASDTKAQIFRFDIDDDLGLITGGKIASLQTESNKENNRRFYYQPDTALIRSTQETFISLSIGSGYRSHPLDTDITDYFYMIKDSGGLSGAFDMLVSQSDLVDITLLVGDGDGDGTSDAAAAITQQSAKGWYLSFSGIGEKVLQRSITFNNAVLFTTYIPPGNGSVACEAVTGSSKLYALKIIDGNPYIDNLVDDMDEKDRIIGDKFPGLAPGGRVIFPEEGAPLVCVGTSCLRKLPPPPEGIMGIRWRKEPAN